MSRFAIAGLQVEISGKDNRYLIQKEIEGITRRFPWVDMVVVDDKLYNTASVFNPDGEVVGRYRKMFPWCPYEKAVTPGEEFLVFDVPGVGRFGLSICYDQWFPETSRSLAWMGAEVILCPTMTATIDRDLELTMARANAITNQCYLFNVNVAGALGNGRSIIVGPDGCIIHQATNKVLNLAP